MMNDLIADIAKKRGAVAAELLRAGIEAVRAGTQEAGVTA